MFLCNCKTHLALSMATVFQTACPKITLELITGVGRWSSVTLRSASLWSQHQAIRTSITLLATYARLTHTLTCHLLTVVTHRAEQ